MGPALSWCGHEPPRGDGEWLGIAVEDVVRVLQARWDDDAVERLQCNNGLSANIRAVQNCWTRKTSTFAKTMIHYNPVKSITINYYTSIYYIILIH